VNKLKVLKKRFLLPLTVIMAALLTTISLVNAAASIEIYGYNDKTQYMSGGEGTFKFWIYNDGTEDIILKNITIEYPWHSLYVWEGNETIIDINTAILVGGNWSTTKTFTVPSDGRAVSGNIRVTVVTDKLTPQTKNFWLNVVGAPSYGSLQDMDKIVTLFTVQVVLVIVCTIIIAATVFLSTRKPQVTWAKEPKAE
jgi:uncharacterized membrane protein